MVAVRKWMMEATTPPSSGNSNPASVSDFPATGGWQKPLKVARRGSGLPIPTQPASVIPDGGEGGRGRGSASRASPTGRPNNPFEVLGRVGEDGPGGPVHPKRARLQSGQVGRAAPRATNGMGPDRPRKSGPLSAQAKGKAAALPESSDAGPGMVEGQSVFLFSAGAGVDQGSQPVDPPAGASLAPLEEPHLQSGGDRDMEVVNSEGGELGRPGDHELVVSRLRQAIQPIEGPSQVGDTPLTVASDEVMLGGDPDETHSP